MKKRLFDLVLAIPALIFLAPVIMVLILLLRISVGKGVFFYQNRPGLHGKPFVIYKFRTMTDELDKDGNLLPDGERLTPLGWFLRKTSMDELPELFNVIKGDMSIVGHKSEVGGRGVGGLRNWNENRGDT